MNTTEIPMYPQQSLSSVGVVYRPLQDIEIYVEDHDSEVFYTELLSRLLEPDYTVKKIIPLNGRENVINECLRYTDPYPAVFLIDGDLYLVSNDDLPSNHRLFIHPCYCVENYLFCEVALTEVLAENSGKMTKSDIQSLLDWESFKTEISDLLVELFLEFATAHKLHPSCKTTSNGFGSVCYQSGRRKPPKLNEAKVSALVQDIRKKICAVVDEDTYTEVRNDILHHIGQFTDKVDIVSGKDFLIPLMMFKSKEITPGVMTKDSFVFRLARHCNTEKLQPLKEHLIESIKKYQ